MTSGKGSRAERSSKPPSWAAPRAGSCRRHLLDTPVDYESLEATGAIMGSGGIVICDESTCMVDSARFFTNFCVDESCGKCVPCRIGLTVMLRKLEDIVGGRGKEGDVEFLEELGRHIVRMSHCGLGQSAPNPVLSTIRHFRHEYDEHIRDKHCRSLVCTPLDPVRSEPGEVQDVRPLHEGLPEQARSPGKRKSRPRSTRTSAPSASRASGRVNSGRLNNIHHRGRRERREFKILRIKTQIYEFAFE